MQSNPRPIVTRKGEGSANTGQSGGLKLMTGVGPQNTPATKLWFGTAGNPPGFRSLPHHHGEAETGAYVLIHHLECNMSTTEELWWLACRTPENIVVNLPDIDDALLKGYRRA